MIVSACPSPHVTVSFDTGDFIWLWSHLLFQQGRVLVSPNATSWLASDMKTASLPNGDELWARYAETGDPAEVVEACKRAIEGLND